MKKLFLFFVLFSGLAFAQMENFVIDNSQVSWQKVYETNKNFEEIVESLKRRNNLIIKEKNENSLDGEISNLIMDYKKAGHTYMGTPIILNETNKYKGFFKLEFKEGKYRATVRNVSSEGMTVTMYGSGLGLGSQLDTTLENMALNKKGELRKGFPKVSGKIIDVTFTNLFDFTKIEENKKTDW